MVKAFGCLTSTRTALYSQRSRPISLTGRKEVGRREARAHHMYAAAAAQREKAAASLAPRLSKSGSSCK